jgi:hypothetical protein
VTGIGGQSKEIAMEADIKDVVGILMRVLGGGDVSLEELNDLRFDTDGEIGSALTEAYVKLREFAIDRDLRLSDPKADRDLRADLQKRLDKIVRACDRAPRTAPRDRSSRAARSAGAE